MTGKHSCVNSTCNRNSLKFHSEEQNGYLQACSITLINKTDGSGPTRREECWPVVLKTVAPYELNMIEKGY